MFKWCRPFLKNICITQQTASELGFWEVIINARELEAQTPAKFIQGARAIIENPIKGTRSIEKLVSQGFSLNSKGKPWQDLDYILLKKFIGEKKEKQRKNQSRLKFV